MGVVGVLAGRSIAGGGQLAGQGELGAVDGEHAVAQPLGPGLVGTAQDLGVELLEDLLVDARPGLAQGGSGDRLRLRQGHVQGAALGPQLGQRGGVALATGGKHEAEHEQHHQQRVAHPAALLPEVILLGGQGAERAEQALPQGDEVGGGGFRLRRLRRVAGLGTRPVQQNRAEVLAERVDEHVLGAAPGVGAGPGLADTFPVGGPVAGSAEASRVYERFDQNRGCRVAALPVRRQLPGRQRQRVTGQIPDRHPGQEEQAGLAQHAVEVLLIRPCGPAPTQASRQASE